MKVTVRFFSPLSDFTGASSLERDVAEETRLIELIEELQAEFPKLAALLPNTYVTLNRKIVAPQTGLKDRDEVALFLAISGGRGSIQYRGAACKV